MIVAVRRLVLAALVLLAPALAAAQTYTITPSPFQTVLNNSGAKVSAACVWVYAAGTTTPATTYTTSTGTANSNPIIADSAGRFTAFLVPGTSYKLVFETACTPPAHGTVLRTADNISGTPTAAASVDVPTAVAGETIGAGLCAYLSDGSGSKIAGQWYKCDSANSYSSTTNVVGLAPLAIASGATGTVRLMGAVTGLSSLSIGSPYFVGTAGAITSSPGTNVRRLGEADTATSLLLKDSTAAAVSTPLLSPLFPGCGVRLTLTSGTAVTTADVTAATNVFVTPYSAGGFGAGVCAFYDGTASWTTLTFTEITVALGTLTSALPYDIFCYNNSGTMACDAPLAWTNTTTRATALVLQNGVQVKSGATTRRFMGSFYTTSTTTTEDSKAKRDLSNYYNRKCRPLFVTDATGGWTYSTATFQQARATATNQVEAMVGVAEQTLDLIVAHFAGGNAGAVSTTAAIGEDSTTTADALMQGGSGTTAGGGGYGGGGMTGRLTKVPAAGWHKYVWLEKAQASGTTTWGNSTTNGPVGLSGCIEN